MKVYLHIGSEKTGTTSVQAWGSINRDALASRHILYPRAVGQRNHIMMAGLAAERQRVRDLFMTSEVDLNIESKALYRKLKIELRKEIQKIVPSAAIISNEHLSSRIKNADQVDIIKRFLDDCFGDKAEYKIIYYIRRQDDMLKSVYSTSIKSGNIKPFHFNWKLSDRRFNPLIVLDMWSEVFGKNCVECRVFDRKILKEGDIIADFYGRMQDDGLILSDYKRIPKDRNKKLSVEALEFLRMFNHEVPRFLDGKVNAERVGLIEMLESMSLSSSVELASRAEFADFLHRFDAVNAEVARKYFGREDGRLFDHDDSKNVPEQPVIPVELRSDLAVQIAAYLWTEQKRQMLARQERRPMKAAVNA